MGVVVQKFGGTSVATAEKIAAAAKRALRAKREGHDVAVIVSARGKSTDELIALAAEIHQDPPAREMDMLMATGEQVSIALLAMAIHAQGHEAVSLTGGQMGIVTDSTHTNARIREISTDRIREVFAAGKIAIIAGFQGVDQFRNITTLGRGGSDTTAVAIAAALSADVCEIHTDVDGVYTSDPRLVPDARKIDQISYDEMLELASLGAGVMHSRSIEFAKKFGVAIHVRNAGHDEPGTIIRPETPTMEHIVVRGAALARDEARVTLTGVPDAPGVVRKLFSRIASEDVVVDMIVQNVARDGRAEISFTVCEADLQRTLDLARQAAAEIGAERVDHGAKVAKVSVIGLGMRTHTGVADRMFKALADQGVNIHMITTSEIKISVLVDAEQAVDALRAVHREFGLHEPLPEHREGIRFRLKEQAPAKPGGSEKRLRAIARSLPAMEDILVSGVELDDAQARVTLMGVPDAPGVAYRIFARIAEAGVAVDMIVQNYGLDGSAQLSFTVPRRDLPAAFEPAEAIMAEFAGHAVADDGMAKISVRGVGMRTHTGVAVRLFEALAARDINVQLINTSELHITVVVDRAHGQAAREALEQAFGADQW